MTFHDHGLAGGIWSGRVTGLDQPCEIAVVHHAEPVATARLTPDGEGAWLLQADLPAHVMSDGLTVLSLVHSQGTGPGNPSHVLGRLCLLAGTPPDDDVLAQIAQLRDELDLLKREFRRIHAPG